jgi:hypothetical protein
MASGTLSWIVILGGWAVIIGFFVRGWWRADLSLGDGEGEISYQQPVTVRVRRSGKTFHDLKAGLSSVVLTVRGGVVSIRFPPLPRRLAASLGLDYTFRADSLTFSAGRTGWSGTRLLGRDAVILFGADARGPLELAVTPSDEDLERLRRVLIQAGASPQPTPQGA